MSYHEIQSTSYSHNLAQLLKSLMGTTSKASILKFHGIPSYTERTLPLPYPFEIAGKGP